MSTTVLTLPLYCWKCPTVPSRSCTSAGFRTNISPTDHRLITPLGAFPCILLRLLAASLTHHGYQARVLLQVVDLFGHPINVTGIKDVAIHTLVNQLPRARALGADDRPLVRPRLQDLKSEALCYRRLNVDRDRVIEIAHILQPAEAVEVRPLCPGLQLLRCI